VTEETQPDDVEEPQGALAGQRLAEARRERDISLADIAKELHLDEPKVRALEENRFDMLGAPVFAKGHLRKYAELVGVPMDDILADYYALNRSVGAPPVVGPPRRHPRDLHLGRWILAIVVIGAVSAAVYWWLQRDGGLPEGVGELTPTRSIEMPVRANTPAGDATDEVEIAVSVSEGVAADAAAADAPPTRSADVATENEAPVADATATDVALRAPPVTTGSQVALTMHFSGDCWTEVSDASGARLYFDLGREDRSVTVRGEAPLRALFGNSENVTLEVDGNDLPISDSMRRGQTARLTIIKP
jgi:cytoskeleton protein RodZ